MSSLEQRVSRLEDQQPGLLGWAAIVVIVALCWIPASNYYLDAWSHRHDHCPSGRVRVETGGPTLCLSPRQVIDGKKWVTK